MLPSDFIRPQYHLPKLRGRQDLLDFRDFFCLHFEFPEEIENTNRFAKGGKGQWSGKDSGQRTGRDRGQMSGVRGQRRTVVRGREGTEVRCRELGVREGQWTEIPGDECLRQG